MDLSVRDVARLISVSERTVYRWAKQGYIPAHKLHDQYRFNRVELLEWAAAHGHRISRTVATGDAPPGAAPGLAEALERGGIHYGIAGASREDVLRNLSRAPGVPAGVDRELLFQLLLGRETLASTAVGGGIALPHARDPLVLRVEGPTVLLGFLAQPVDFGAPDGEPVRALFTLFTPSIRDHLQVLSRLTFALHDAELKRLVQQQAPADKILARVRTLDAVRVSGPYRAIPEPEAK